jgi:hypothetical protein
MIQQASLNAVPHAIKEKVIFYSAYAGIFKAIWHGFYEVLVAMINHSQSLTGCENTGIEIFNKEIKSCL